jgi:S-adenosylmethionine synthetase
MTRNLTSESVSEGHPDKLADQISDAVLDACLATDPGSRAGVETLLKSNLVLVAGELTTSAQLDVAEIIHNVIDDVGYTADAHRDSFACEPGQLQIMTALVKQSPNIAQGVDRSEPDAQGAGDQGMMFGYASRETPSLMPAPVAFAHRLTKATSQARRDGLIEGIRPDAKSMVTVQYDDAGEPTRITDVLMSVQHDADIDLEDLRQQMLEKVILPALPDDMTEDLNFIFNPTGSFVLGGAYADAGLTGRKIIVDTYGGIGRHGGGAFSGKDPSKVDRSAAYAARWVAKNVVAAGAASRCEIQLSYAIGVAHPVSIDIETFGTESVDPTAISSTVAELFDLRPASIIKSLDLLRPIYRSTTTFGHFGREEPQFTWESASKASDLANALGL